MAESSPTTQPRRKRGNAGPRDKKRRRPSKSPTPSSAKTTVSLPPSSILIVDNGGDTIKYGWLDDTEPNSLPNVTARLQHQLTVLVGDELQSVVQNPNQLIGITRSTERGMVVDLGNQVQVWRRLLDLSGVLVPSTATLSLWKTTTRPSSTPKIPSHSCAVLLLIPPHCPRGLLESMVTTWMEEFGFSHVGLAVSPVFVAKQISTCVVDMGWSDTLVVPTFQQRIIDPAAIKRMALGGRHLINIWKYYTSYRQWNMMDQEVVMRDVHEQLGFLSLDFDGDLEQARSLPLGQRPYDRDYVLPDYQNTFRGFVQLPAPLRREQEQLEQEKRKQEQEDAEGETAQAEDGAEEDGHDSEDGEDGDEETLEQAQRRILRQKAEEERRKRELEEEQQVLRVSVERFTIPEVLFRPCDHGLPPAMAGLPETILQAIMSCPEHYHAILFQSIHISGGLARIQNLKDRLERDLRAIAPCEYQVRITVSESSVEEAWKGANRWVRQSSYEKWSISREEWEASKGKAWNRLLDANGGMLV